MRTLDRAADILIRRLVRRPRLYEVEGVEDSGKQPRTGASRSRVCFARPTRPGGAGEIDAAAQLEAGRLLTASDVAVGRIEVKSEAFRQTKSAAARIQLDHFWFGSRVTSITGPNGGAELYER